MFTNSEKAYITQSFELEQVKSHFFKEGVSDLDPTKDAHILKVLFHRDNKIGFIGKEGHDLMHAIYHKLGYGKDGMTTLAAIAIERERMNQLEQNQLKELKDSAIKKVENQMKELEGILEDLKMSSSDIEAFEATERAKLEAELEKKLRKEEKKMIQKESRKITKATDLMNIPQLKKLAKQRNLTGYSKLRKNELIHLINKEIN